MKVFKIKSTTEPDNKELSGQPIKPEDLKKRDLIRICGTDFPGQWYFIGTVVELTKEKVKIKVTDSNLPSSEFKEIYFSAANGGIYLIQRPAPES